MVDADWNEAHDIRKDEVGIFLRQFVGNGVPLGDNGFAISTFGANDDFRIEPGLCLVEGWLVSNEQPINYTEQVLFEDTALAEQWGVDSLPALNTPESDRTPRFTWMFGSARSMRGRIRNLLTPG